MDNREKHWIFVFAPVILVIILSVILQATVLSNTQAVRVWLESFGAWFYVVYIVVQTVSVIIAPIGGAFIWLPMMAILGPGKGLVLSYLVMTPAFCVNFYLAKKFGRNLVVKLVGRGSLLKIDHIAADAGVSTLAIFKVFQGGYFDYVSYAAGLTKISWKEFFLVNFLGGIPSALITYFVFSQFENFLAGVLVWYVITGLMVGIAVYIHHLRRKQTS